MYPALLSAAHSLHPVGRLLKQLRKTQWFSQDELQRLQLKRLRRMLRHCYQTVPFYHQEMKKAGIRPEDIRSTNDLTRLPVVDKNRMRREERVFRSLAPERHLTTESTSGSTGAPLRFPRSRRTYHEELAASRRHYGWTGYQLGEKWANIRLVRTSGFPLAAFIETTRDILWRRLRVDHYMITRDMIDTGIQRIADFSPLLVRAFARSLIEFGRLAPENGVQVPYIVSTGERITPSERKNLENNWGGELFDMYGTAEARTIAAECSQHSGLHITDELYILEFVKGGEHVAPGEQGTILVTSLCHWTHPFIRYDTEDLSTPVVDPCPCGRGLSRMANIEGRYADVLETSDGKLIFATTYNSLFAGLPVRQHQIEQRSRRETIIRIVPEEGFHEEHRSVIERRAKLRLGTSMCIEIQETEHIPDYRSGKRQVVKSHVSFPDASQNG
jgi:phenylacetate-CoA ligase